MGIFNSNKDRDRYREYNYSFRRPSMFGGFAFFPPVIKYLLISNVIIFLFQMFFFGQRSALGIWFMRMFALMPIDAGFLPWQLFTYQFMHGGFFHLLMNMFALWMFGMELENLWGSKKFLFYYLMCGVGAGIANLFIAPLFTSVGPTIGASGAVYGILAAFGYLFPERQIYLYFLFPIRAKYFILLYMGLELISIGRQDGVAHFAHLGGAVIGFIYLFFSKNKNYLSGIKPKRRTTQTREASNVYRNKYYDKYNEADDDVSDAEYFTDKKDEVSQERIDEILDKISKEGYKNLTEEEKRILFDASKKLH